MIRDKALAAKHGLSYVDLAMPLQEVERVTVHTPVRPATRGLMDREKLGTMKPTAYLVNTSRGPTEDEEALHWVLTNAVIPGAGSRRRGLHLRALPGERRRDEVAAGPDSAGAARRLVHDVRL